MSRADRPSLRTAQRQSRNPIHSITATVPQNEVHGGVLVLWQVSDERLMHAAVAVDKLIGIPVLIFLFGYHPHREP